MSRRPPVESVVASLCWLLSVAGAFAQQSSLEVRSPSALEFSTVPGRIVTASVVLVNRGAETDEVIERLVLPPGFQQVAPPPGLPVRIEAASQVIRVLALLVPAETAAGHFEVRYTAQSRRDPSSSGQLSFSVAVAPVNGLALVVEPRPDLVLAGDTYPVKLRVTNRGNSRLSVQLTQRSTLGFPIKSPDSAFPLEAGATREIIATVETDKNYTKHTRHAVTFDVLATSTTGETLKASQASVVEIVPLVAGSRDSFHYLPMQLRLVALGGSGRRAQSQAELSGSGFLDEAGQQGIDFVFRGPDTQNATLFGERDEYGVSYHSPHWDFDAGDRVFELSPLTERHTFARGVGLHWHDDTTAAGAFAMRTRFRLQGNEEYGAYLRQRLTPSLSLQANFLRKTGGDRLGSSALPQHIATLESRYRWDRRLELRLEAGASLSDRGQWDFAYRAEARGELPGKLSYAVEHVHAGPNFRGYYSDNETTNATVTKVLSSKFRARVSLNQYAGNLAQTDVRSSVVNRENSWSLGLDYDWSKQTSFSLEGQHIAREDTLQPAAYDFSSESLRLGAGHHVGPLHLQSFLELGTLDNRLTGENGAFQRYSITAGWRATPRQTYSVFANYGPSAFTGSTQQQLSAGVSAQWRIHDSLEANLSYARNQFNGLTGRQQDQAIASITYRFQNKSSLSLLGRWSRAVDKSRDSASLDESALLVTCTIPFRMPVSRKRSIGILRGRLLHETERTGVPRAVLQVGGQFTATDEAGNFEFPELKPGSCELKILPDSLGSHLAMVTALPLKVRVGPAETTSVQLVCAPACAVRIRVLRHEFAKGSLHSPGALQETGGQEGVAIELCRGGEILRGLTDRTGTASFDRLAGGSWSVRCAAPDLPAHYSLEAPPADFTLRAGETRDLVLRVLPQRRTLRMLDQGSIE